IGLCLAAKRRTAGTLLVFGWLVVIGLTYSRGGVVVAIVVVALWMLLSHAWIEALSTLIAAGLPAAGALAVAFSLDGITADGQTHAARVHAGIVFGIVLAVDALIAVGLSRFPLPQVTAVKRLALAGLAVVLGAAVGVSAAHAHSWWSSFTTSSGTGLTNSPSRPASPGGDLRHPRWEQARTGLPAP